MCYISKIDDREALTRDAFSIDWGRFARVYANPEWQDIEKTVEKWKTDRAIGTLVTPLNESASWCRDLIKMSATSPIRVDAHAELFLPVSLMNSAGVKKTPWRYTILWNLNGKQVTQKATVEMRSEDWLHGNLSRDIFIIRKPSHKDVVKSAQ